MSEIDERLLLPKKLMAKAFGISVTAFDKWDVKPTEKRGREQLYYLPDVMQFRLGRDNKTSLDLQTERARLAAAQANKTEIEVSILRGNVFKSEHVESAWIDMLSACRAKLLSIPTKLAAILANEKNQIKTESILRDSVNEALLELSNYDAKKYNKSISPQGDEPDDAASDFIDEPMGGSESPPQSRE